MDRRDMRHQWYQSENAARMQITYVDHLGIEHTIPAKYEVCGTCEGQGTHVNPSIDAHGISAEEFAEDPDFREDYFTGKYDVQCNECHGLRVVLVPDESRISLPERDEIELIRRQFYDMQAEEAAERRWGA